jgi:UDP-N-acetylmuramate dehydrogenase
VDVADVKVALAFARSHEIAVHIVGSGSNTLVRDGGIRGMVILPSGLQDLERRGNTVWAGAGVRVSRLLAFCSKQGLCGLEILSGVPGTVGGAVWGNAGAWGGSAADHVTWVQVVTDRGEEITLPREVIPFGYRSSGLPRGSVIIRAAFALVPDAPTAIRRRISRWLVQRNAGRLVEAAGLKGSRIGDAMVSEKHGNFFVNLRQARAADVLALVALAQERVRATAGIELELEIRVVGED